MKKRYNFQQLFIFLILLSSCISKNISICKFEGLKTLYTVPAVYEGKVTGYTHYVLIKDFDRICMDSTTMVNTALNYSDTIKTYKPANVIMFFNSDEEFVLDEISQDMKNINKSCLVVIGLDLTSKKADDFIFYNDKGQRVYWGKRWSPKG